MVPSALVLITSSSASPIAIGLVAAAINYLWLEQFLFERVLIPARELKYDDVLVVVRVLALQPITSAACCACDLPAELLY